jgi:3',5'-cyclic-AMP phosphodiesterase
VDLTFAVCTDLHFGKAALYRGKLRKLSAEAPALLRAFVHRLRNEVKPDFLVNLGDDIEDENAAADEARYRECVGILSESSVDVVHVAGNHDTVHLPAEFLLKEWARTNSEGLLHYDFHRSGIHFIVMHTHEEKDRSITVDDAQLAWLDRCLEDHGPTIVFVHHSFADQDLTGNRWFEGRANICLVEGRKHIRARFERHGDVLAVFNGHLHWNHLDVIRGIPYVTLQSLIENLDDDAPGRPANAHAVVRVTRARVVVEVGGVERARYQFDRRPQ